MGIALSITISASAQKHIENYDPDALFNEGILLFQNQEYGAALSTFAQYRTLVADAKSQRFVDAQYYEAVSALYLGHADGPAKVVQFVNDNPGSTWARHANFLYANHLFKEKKYKEALGIYEKTDAFALTANEAQQMQFNMGYANFHSGELDKARLAIIMLISNMSRRNTMRLLAIFAFCALIRTMARWCLLTSCKSTI